MPYRNLPMPSLSSAHVRTFHSRVAKGKGRQCWRWRGASPQGYGIIYIGTLRLLAHRVAYFMATCAYVIIATILYA